MFWTDESALSAGALLRTAGKSTQTPSDLLRHARMSTRICGDDLLGHWHPEQIEEYEKLIL
jgi:hypothetical protein